MRAPPATQYPIFNKEYPTEQVNACFALCSDVPKADTGAKAALTLEIGSFPRLRDWLLDIQTFM